MVYKTLPLYQKLKLLLTIYLSKLNLIKLRWVCQTMPLNERIENELNRVCWHYLPTQSFSWGFQYSSEKFKKLTDPTGEYRFYIPSLNDKVIWRVNLGYRGLPLPLILKAIVEKDGNKNKAVYEAVSSGEGLEKFENRLSEN